MIPRYSRPAMSAIWSDQNRLKLWQEIEILTCEARAELGEISSEEAREIRERAAVDLERVQKREAETQHDVAAFVDVLSDSIGPASRHVHFGLTSSDILDTALAVQLRDSGRLLLDGVGKLRAVLRRRALEFKRTPMVGRTHGVHAEPITFGLKVLHWYSEAGRVERRLQAALAGVAVGKLSGAVGTFAYLEPEVEQHVCGALGLRPEPLATQVVPRDRHAGFIASLAFLGACLERIGTEIRHLQRTEVLEVEERFGAQQKGSSAMPHKRNPIRSERLVGLSRLLRSHVAPALENVALWHERDISHSSIERVMLPDACLAADYGLDLATRMLDRLVVYPERMRRNLEATRGLVFSQGLLLHLVGAGLLREEAYRLVQSASLAARDSDRGLREVALETPGIVRALGRQTTERTFDLEQHLRHVERLFDRVLGGEAD
ncbi:MAG: adenylosuccinate lyase [Candidatus Krumholzibacteriia bacterium]